MNAQQHKMVLEKNFESGEEEWYCPTCGRYLVVKWEPRFEKSVLQPGDELAIHCGGKGGIEIESIRVATKDDVVWQDDLDFLSEDERLAPWIEWMDRVGFESLWNE